MVVWRRQRNSRAAFRGWRGVQEALVGSRKMRKVEIVAVLQVDTKPKGRSFWSSTACSQLLLKPLLAVGPAGRAGWGTVSAKEGLEPSLPLPDQQPVPKHVAAARSPYTSAKAVQILPFSSAVLAPAEIQEHKDGHGNSRLCGFTERLSQDSWVRIPSSAVNSLRAKPQVNRTRCNCRTRLPLRHQNYQLNKNCLLQSLGAQ